MTKNIGKTLETATFKRLAEVQTELTERFPWFKGLPEERRMDIALKVINMDKVGLQKIRFIYDLFIHLVPWIIALVAILKK